jgi:hypothetical protein
MPKSKFLFLDFDGVTHPYDHQFMGAPMTLHWHDQSISLFCYAPILERILSEVDPENRVGIILSTTWQQRIGWRAAAKFLPPALQKRVVGGVYKYGLSRGAEIAMHAMDYKLDDDSWIAVDDDDWLWPQEHLSRFIKADPAMGLSSESLQQELKMKLKELLA